MTGKVNDRNEIVTKKHTSSKITLLTLVLKGPDICVSSGSFLQ